MKVIIRLWIISIIGNFNILCGMLSNNNIHKLNLTNELFNIQGTKKQEEFCKKLINQACAEFNKGNLHLFDGINGNEQCHINAFMICSLFNKTKMVSFNEKKRLNHTVRWITLNFFLSAIWIQGRSILEDKLKSPFVQDKQFIKNAKKNLNQLHQQCITNMLNTFTEQNLIGKNNRHILDIMRFNAFYITHQFPKFLGIELVLACAAQNNIPFLIKKKNINKNGNIITCSLFCPEKNGFRHIHFSNLDKKRPVIVIECISCSDNIAIKKFDEFLKLRKKCPHSLFNNQQQTHPLKDACLLCNDNNKQSVITKKGLTLPFSWAQLAVAAEFNKHRQKATWNILTNKPKAFPFIAQRLIFFQELAEKHKMHKKDIRSFAIEHMYPSTFEKAVKTKRLIDTTPKELLNTFGVYK